ncbi:MAG TPA: hypothetical protein VF680_03165 [Allosphingosinicella sp.]
MRLLSLVPVALLAVAACDVGDAPAVTPIAERLPAEVCRQAKAALDKSVEGGALVLNSPTDAVIPQEGWFAIDAGGREALQTAMALSAVCAGEPRLEQEVTVHSEDGQVLSRRVIKTSYSTAEALSL